MYRKKSQIQELYICGIDLLCVLISFLLAGVIRYRSIELFREVVGIVPALTGIILIHFAAFYIMKVYDEFFIRGPLAEARKIVEYNIILFLGITAYIFSTKNTMFLSRLTVIYLAITNTVFVFLIHLGIKYYYKYIYSKGKTANQILVITTAECARQVVADISSSSAWNCRIAGLIIIDSGEKIGAENILGIPVVGNAEDYLSYAKINVVDEVFIQVPNMQEQAPLLKNMILELEQMGIVVQVNIDIFDFEAEANKRIYRLGKFYVVAFSSRFFDYRLVIIKRLMDIVGALIGLAFTGALTLFLAPILLLESPGPLIFKQKRVGKNGRIFEFYKFRSMYRDAEERKTELLARNEMQGGMFKIKNDPRITKVGKVIRKTSIDELPQFWNVLKGDMSLVGTRPPTLDEYQQYENHQKRRISFKPGITGLWQISGRSDITDFEEVVKLDLKYIDSWSIGLDIKILIKTVTAVLRGTGAK